MYFQFFLHLVYFEFQFHYKQEGSYSIGTVGWVDEDCDFVDFTYVSVGLRNKNDKFLPSEYQEYCDRRLLHCFDNLLIWLNSAQVRVASDELGQ